MDNWTIEDCSAAEFRNHLFTRVYEPLGALIRLI